MIDGVWISPPMIPQLTQELGVHRTTVSRWMQRRKLPTAVHKLLDITTNGALRHIHPAWEEWNIDVRNGDLILPTYRRGTRETITATEVTLMPIRYEQVQALTDKADALTARCQAQERMIQELTERCEAQAARIEDLETQLAGYTAGSVVAMRPRR